MRIVNCQGMSNFTPKNGHFILLSLLTCLYVDVSCRISDFLMKVEALLVSAPQREPRRDVSFDQTSHSVLKIAPKSNGPAYEIVAILDPTTRAAQKYSPVIMVGLLKLFVLKFRCAFLS
jgi:hypothetical protein